MGSVSLHHSYWQSIKILFMWLFHTGHIISNHVFTFSRSLHDVKNSPEILNMSQHGCWFKEHVYSYFKSERHILCMQCLIWKVHAQDEVILINTADEWHAYWSSSSSINSLPSSSRMRNTFFTSWEVFLVSPHVWKNFLWQKVSGAVGARSSVASRLRPWTHTAGHLKDSTYTLRSKDTWYRTLWQWRREGVFYVCDAENPGRLLTPTTLCE